MTLAIKSPVKRETSTLYRRRALLVEVTAYSAVIREKGRRDAVTVPWDVVYEVGMKLLAREAKAVKRGAAK